MEKHEVTDFQSLLSETWSSEHQYYDRVNGYSDDWTVFGVYVIRETSGVTTGIWDLGGWAYYNVLVFCASS